MTLCVSFCFCVLAFRQLGAPGHDERDGPGQLQVVRLLAGRRQNGKLQLCAPVHACMHVRMCACNMPVCMCACIVTCTLLTPTFLTLLPPQTPKLLNPGTPLMEPRLYTILMTKYFPCGVSLVYLPSSFHNTGLVDTSAALIRWTLKLLFSQAQRLGGAVIECCWGGLLTIAVPEDFIPRVWSRGRAPWTSDDVNSRFGQYNKRWEASPIPEHWKDNLHDHSSEGDQQTRRVEQELSTVHQHFQSRRILRKLRRFITLRGYGFYRGRLYNNTTTLEVKH